MEFIKTIFMEKIFLLVKLILIIIFTKMDKYYLELKVMIIH